MGMPPVVGVWKVRMLMGERLVPMHMMMPGSNCYRNVVPVLVVFVMDVFMIVSHRFMSMFVLMTFAEMQAGAQRHQGPGDK